MITVQLDDPYHDSAKSRTVDFLNSGGGGGRWAGMVGMCITNMGCCVTSCNAARQPKNLALIASLSGSRA